MDNNRITEITDELIDSGINYILITSIPESDNYTASLKLSGGEGIDMLIRTIDALLDDLPEGGVKDLIFGYVNDLISNNKEG